MRVAFRAIITSMLVEESKVHQPCNIPNISKHDTLEELQSFIPPTECIELLGRTVAISSCFDDDGRFPIIATPSAKRFQYIGTWVEGG